MNSMYEYLNTTYGKNTPIILRELNIKNKSSDAIRQSLSRLQKIGLISRYDTGIYYIPKNTINDEKYLSFESVVERKYIKNENEVFGFYSGIYLKNRFNLTQQVPNTFEIITNLESTNKRTVVINNREIILKKSRTIINKENVLLLEFLELINSVSIFDMMKRMRQLENYIVESKFTRKDLKKYIKFYPTNALSNLIESGLIYAFI